MVFQDDGVLCLGLRYATNNLLPRLHKISKLLIASFYTLELIQGHLYGISLHDLHSDRELGTRLTGWWKSSCPMLFSLLVIMY